MQRRKKKLFANNNKQKQQIGDQTNDVWLFLGDILFHCLAACSHREKYETLQKLEKSFSFIVCLQ